MSVFQFGYQSPSRGHGIREQAARDLRAVGAASNAPELGGIADATLFFGIAMDGPWIVPQSFLSNLGIDVDTDLDGVTDYELTHGSSGDVLVSGDITERELADDAYFTIIDSLELENPKLGGILNVFSSAERETSLLNNSVMIYSAKAADFGLANDNTRIQYRFHNITETTRWIPFDAARPALRTANPAFGHSPYHAADAPVVIASATSTPADLLGIDDIGRIAPGARADLTLFDTDLSVTHTIIGGEVVWKS